jgi:hypothetical protein
MSHSIAPIPPARYPSIPNKPVIFFHTLMSEIVPDTIIQSDYKLQLSKPSAKTVSGFAATLNGDGTEIVFASAVTVPPYARALPESAARCPNVMPAASKTFPTNVALAPSVVAATGAQNTLEGQAPLARITLESAPIPSAPVDLKM